MVCVYFVLKIVAINDYLCATPVNMSLFLNKTDVLYCLNQVPHNMLLNIKYRKTPDIRRTLVGITIVTRSDVVGASPVGAAPTTSEFST